MTLALAPPPRMATEVLTAFWAEMSDRRTRLHHQYQLWYCDTELHVGGLGFGSGCRHGAGEHGDFHLAGTCPCRDLVLDAFLIVLRYLTEHGAELRNPPGAIRHHLQMKLVDLDRAQRNDKGAQTKPAAVRKNRYARALPDDIHREVLVMVVDEAGRRTPLGGQPDLVCRLAQRCARKFGGSAADYQARLPHILATIEHVCQTGPRVDVGTDRHRHLVSWWDAYVVLPLGRRPNPCDVPLWDTGSEDMRSDDIVLRFDDPAADDDMVVTALSDIGWVPEDDRDAALRNRIADLEHHGLLPPARAKLLRSRPDLRRRVLESIEALVHPVREITGSRS